MLFLFKDLSCYLKFKAIINSLLDPICSKSNHSDNIIFITFSYLDYQIFLLFIKILILLINHFRIFWVAIILLKNPEQLVLKHFLHFYFDLTYFSYFQEYHYHNKVLKIKIVLRIHLRHCFFKISFFLYQKWIFWISYNIHKFS